MREKWGGGGDSRGSNGIIVSDRSGRNEHSTQSTETSLLFTRILASVFGVYRFVRSISTREPATIDTIRRELRITPFFLFFFLFFFFFFVTPRRRSFEIVHSAIFRRLSSQKFPPPVLIQFNFLDTTSSSSFFVLRRSSPLRFLAITAKSDCSADKTFKRDIYICIYIY